MQRKSSLLTSSEHQSLHKTLMAWGVLTRLELGGFIGSLSDNRLYTLSRLGMKTSYRSPGIQWSCEATQIDQLINQLYRVKPKWADAVKWYYTELGNIRYQAKLHNVPTSTYHERIQKGREWLGQALTRLH